MNLIFPFLLITGTIFLIYQIYFRGEESGEEGSRRLPIKRTPWRGLLIVLLIKAGLAVLLLSEGYTSIWQDDIARWCISHDWSKTPWFGKGDHVWLPMCFYIYGTFMKIIPNQLLAVRMASLLISFASLFSIYYITSSFVRNKSAGFWAALLLCFVPVHSWLSLTTMSDLIYIVFMGFSMGLFFSYLNFIHAGDMRRARNRMILFSISCTGLTATRYEGWILTICLGLAFCLHWIIARVYKKGIRWIWFWSVLAGMALFPLLWMASSWYELKNPLGFFINQAKLNEHYAAFCNQTNSISEKLMRYPKTIKEAMGGLLILCITGIISCFLQAGKKPVMAFGAGVCLLYFIMMEISSIIGGTSMGLDRCILFFIFILIPFALVPLYYIHERKQNIKPVKYYTWIAVLALPFLPYTFNNIRETFRWQTWGWEVETIGLAKYLQAGFHNNLGKGYFKKDEHVLIWYKMGDMKQVLFKYLNGNNPQIFLNHSEKIEEYRLSQPNLLIISHSRELKDERWREVGQFGDYRFYRMIDTNSEDMKGKN
jgi:4-amino-4-deoxy-L-arabinose transferase-like glycosyltransferase